jgi:hypothetical protein
MRNRTYCVPVSELIGKCVQLECKIPVVRSPEQQWCAQRALFESFLIAARKHRKPERLCTFLCNMLKIINQRSPSAGPVPLTLQTTLVR